MKAGVAVCGAIVVSLCVLGFFALILVFGGPVFHCIQGGCDDIGKRNAEFPYTDALVLGAAAEAQLLSDPLQWVHMRVQDRPDPYVSYDRPYGFYHERSRAEPHQVAFAGAVEHTTTASAIVASGHAQSGGNDHNPAGEACGVSSVFDVLLRLLGSIFVPIVGLSVHKLGFVVFGIVTPLLILIASMLFRVVKYVRRRFSGALPVFRRFRCCRNKCEEACPVHAVAATVDQVHHGASPSCNSSSGPLHVAEVPCVTASAAAAAVVASPVEEKPSECGYCAAAQVPVACDLCGRSNAPAIAVASSSSIVSGSSSSTIVETIVPQ